jgi:hypothetical protein
MASLGALLHRRQLSPSPSAAALTVSTAAAFTVSTAATLTVSTDLFAGRHAAIWKIDGFCVKGKLWKLIFDPYFVLPFGIESKSLEIDRRLV